MIKYIDAEVLKNNIHKCTWVHDTKCVEKFVDSLPAADVEEVRHGRWEFNIDDKGWSWDNPYICDQCRKWNKRDTNYCPSCGAKMDEVTEE